MTSGVPEGYATLSSVLVVDDAAAAIDFYVRAFDGREILRLTGPDGRLAHAEVRIGDSVLMLADEAPEWGSKSARTLGDSPARMHLYVADVDAVVERAVAAGATVEIPVTDQFYGDRTGRIVDPFGHRWIVATRREEMTPAEMQRRFESWLAEQGGGEGDG